MKITFIGGADEVGASSILIEMSGRRILVDCGIRPSPKTRFGLAGDQLGDLSLLERGGGLDAILVTHAHTDHTGALELVVERFPHIPVYATEPTIALTRVLHADSRRIMQTRLEEEGELPIFDDVAVNRLMASFEPVAFLSRVSLGVGLTASFFPAGHIAGAAMILLESDEGSVLISGDVSFSPQRTVNGAKLPNIEPDVLVLESTYGGRMHANRQVQELRMIETVRQVTGAGGKVLIPAFALGRAQEVLLILSEAQRSGALPPVPVWADGMVRAVCQIYSSFSDVLPLALQEQGADFFKPPVRAIQSAEQRNALLWQAESAVVVSSSGMLSGGPSTAYAQAFAGQKQHAILLTGYQDEEAPGRRLQEMAERGHGTLYLGKNKVDVQCTIGTYSLSAHADEGQLISMVETLNPAHVLLVHGDEDARESLQRALTARRRSVFLPKAGQSLAFRFTAAHSQPARGAGTGQNLDVKRLWQVIGTEGGYFTLEELAAAWWGEAFGAAERDELADALAEDELYFIPDARRAGYYRAHPRAQVEVTLQRRVRMSELADLPGQWLALRSAAGAPQLVRCISLALDHFWVETLEGETERAWPEDLQQVFGLQRPSEIDLQAAPQSLSTHRMEPNQALALVNTRFPKEARLRKTGYRLDEHRLTLTFDFPDTARGQYAEEIAALAEETGWEVELAPESNQGALFSLAGEVLGEGARVVKGPALYRETREVALTLAAGTLDEAALSEAQRRFQAQTGFSLVVSLAAPEVMPMKVDAARRSLGEPVEINEAYRLIRAVLEGSTLYRTSLKGGQILLSFISSQVGARYQDEIEVLAEQVGYPLAISPQANQAAILETAQSLLSKAGAAVLKGPGIYPEKGEVIVTASLPTDDILDDLALDFEEKTGFRLVINTRSASGQKSVPPSPADQAENILQIPIARVRLRRYHQSLVLDPTKVEKAVERVKRLGQITPPIQVRRVQDGYLLIDGLYRLKAAEALGLTEIPAMVE